MKLVLIDDDDRPVAEVENLDRYDLSTTRGRAMLVDDPFKSKALFGLGTYSRKLRESGLYKQERTFKEKKVKPGDKFVFRSYEPSITSVVPVCQMTRSGFSSVSTLSMPRARSSAVMRLRARLTTRTSTAGSFCRSTASSRAG